MKKAAIALILGGFCLGAAYAQQPQAPAQPQAKEAGKPMKPEHKKPAHMKVFKGKVEAVDAATAKLTIKEKDKTTDFTIAEEVKITKAGKKAALADIAVGDMVKIEYEGEPSMPIVKAVKAESPKAMKGKKDMKKEEKPEGKKMQ